MYVLDTNVVSELMKPNAEPSVRARIAALQPVLLFTTAITSAEIFAGIARLPAGRRRDGLQTAAESMFRQVFAGRVLPFDEAASRVYALITASRRARGRPIEDPDAQIAAIAAVHRHVLVTRNVPDFDHCGLTVIDPWTSTIPVDGQAPMPQTATSSRWQP